MSLQIISEKDLERGRLIYAFAKDPRTSERERKVGQLQLDKFCQKHGITEDDLNPAVNTRIIKSEHQDEVDLLLTIILSLNPYTRYKITGLEVSCDLDPEDYAELLSKYNYFVKLWRVEKELLYRAFFSKHTRFFQADAQAHSKWRKNTVKNENIDHFAGEIAEANAVFLKMQSDFNTGRVSEKKLAEDVINSQDRIKIMAFNTNRAYHLEELLLKANYIKNSKTIK